MSEELNQPLKGNPRRQAGQQRKGFVYQNWYTVLEWLSLEDVEVLYAEGAEDFDRIKPEDSLAVQVKHTESQKITLGSEYALDALNNFWEILEKNKKRKIRYRFLTTSDVGKEQNSTFSNAKGIEVWEQIRKQHSIDVPNINAIKDFLLAKDKLVVELKNFLKESSEELIFNKLIAPFEWAYSAEN